MVGSTICADTAIDETPSNRLAPPRTKKYLGMLPPLLTGPAHPADPISLTKFSRSDREPSVKRRRDTGGIRIH
jgi:hypothetical protein